MKKSIFKAFCILLTAVMMITVSPIHYAFAEEAEISSASELQNQNSAVTYSAAAASSGGTWIKSSNGKWWYKHSDGSYTKNDWEYIDGSWYYFDSNGWMLSAQWLKWDGNWYYLNPSGVMHTGWLNNNDKWYYFNMRGIMQTGWVKPDDYWYYLDSTGVMQMGWRKINGYWYYFESTGRMRTTVLKQNQRMYYFKTTGEMYGTRIFGIHQHQQKYNWCWAACAIMVGTYNITNPNVTQQQIVSKYSVNDEWGTLIGTISAVEFASMYTKNAYYCQIEDFNTIVNYIDSNKPFILNASLKEGGKGHSIVCSGYFTLGNLIHITDPAQEFEIDPATSNIPCYFNYNEMFKTGFKLGNNSYICKKAIVY